MKSLGVTFLIFIYLSCNFDLDKNNLLFKPEPQSLKMTKKKTSSKINQYLSPLLCDGFSSPLKNQHNKYEINHTNTLTGEKWVIKNHNTPLTFSSIGTGVVTKIENHPDKGNAIEIQHIFMVNGKLDTIYAVYKNIELPDQNNTLKVHDTLSKNNVISNIKLNQDSSLAYLHIETRLKSLPLFLPQEQLTQKFIAEHFINPSTFIKKHQKLSVPNQMKKVFIAIKKQYKLYIIKKGLPVDTIAIALGQNPLGHKKRQGDNRTPEGEYQLIQNAKGPFSGAVGPYFGPRWIRINYPNAFDAELGYSNKTISKTECDKIKLAIKNRKQPPKTTSLGGGIGIHGWSGEWDEKGVRDLTWGCISINNSDLVPFYEQVNIGDTIIISE